MSRMKVFCVALLAMCVFGVAMSATASATECAKESKCLPLVHILSGENFPLLLEGATKKEKGAAELRQVAGSLGAEQLKLLVEVKELGSTGTFDAHFVNTTENGAVEEKKCSTAGDESGVVLVKGTFRLVFIKYVPLEVGSLFEFEPFSVICKNKSSETTIKVTGSLVGRVKPAHEKGEDEETLATNSICTGAGKQEVTEYFEDNLKEVKAVLEANLGGKKEKACELVKENPFTLKIKSTSTAKMFSSLW